MTSAPDARRALPLGWILLLVLAAYALAIHHGVGPEPMGGAGHWWQPTGFLSLWLSATVLGAWLDTPQSGLVALTTPAVILAMAVWASTRSAVARSLSVACVFATALFLFYGLGGTRSAIWGFFHWRGSAVMALFALVSAAVVTAPQLARSWLRHRWPARIALCLPVWLLVVLAQRDVTGTDPSLAFAISPWPVVTVFGLEIGAVLVSALLAALALGAAGTALWSEKRALAIACAALAIGSVGAAVGVRIQPGTTLLWIAVGLAAAALGALAVAPGTADAGGAAKDRARHLAVGTLLAAMPLLLGFLLTARDYETTRKDAAGRIIEALQRYYEREQVYPETLAELVDAKDIDVLPAPRIGFGWLGAMPDFTYQSFGTSFLLEFSAPRWVQCAYNPPYPEDDGEDPDEASADGAGAEDGGDAENADVAGQAADGDGALARGSWSCPSKPPELW